MVMISDAQSLVASVAPSLVSGAVVAVAFNPIDRALYLSVKEKRPLFISENFRSPFQGFASVAWFRIISSGSYFCVRDAADSLVTLGRGGPNGDMAMRPSVVGIATGVLNGALLHPFSAIKYSMWAKDDATMAGTMRHMWNRGGFKPFFAAYRVTAVREAAFGSIYESSRFFLRQQLRSHDASTCRSPIVMIPTKIMPMHFSREFACDCTAATLAAIASSPINFVRTMQLATPSGCVPPSFSVVLSQLHRDIMQQRSLWLRLSYAQDRLRIGWGSVRVGLGMAVGDLIFRFCKNTYVAL